MKPRSLAYPDLILFNGKIRTFGANGATHEALASAGRAGRSHSPEPTSDCGPRLGKTVGRTGG